MDHIQTVSFSGCQILILARWPVLSDVTIRVGSSSAGLMIRRCVEGCNQYKHGRSGTFSHCSTPWLMSKLKDDWERKSGGTSGHISQWNNIFDDPLAHVGAQHINVSPPGFSKCVKDVYWHIRINSNLYNQTHMVSRKWLSANISWRLIEADVISNMYLFIYVFWDAFIGKNRMVIISSLWSTP